MANTAPPGSTGASLRFQALNWIGIVDQLATTKANRVLDAIGLPMPQFAMLNHFSHRPALPRTVTGIAAAFQQQQPGVTKTVQKLLDKGYLRVESDPGDGRVRHLFLTEAGAQAHTAARESLTPLLDDAFTGWSDDEVGQLVALLDRLRIYLDANRDPA